MCKVISLTGASGCMGQEVLRQLMQCDFVDRIKVLMLPTASEKRCYRKWKRQYGNKIEPIFGNIAIIEDCQKLLSNSDYVVNMAAVIPPKSDHEHEKAYDANILGPKNLVSVLQTMQNPPKFIHISSVAVYGNRNYLHPWGRVGDPLLPSVFDVYAQQKMTAELFVTESNLASWCILRQTAMLHNKMLTNNMKDGLMFHTCFNTPLEWVSAKDSGLLIKNIISQDVKAPLKNFWKNIFNIGGGKDNRTTGFGTFDQGFKIIGGSTEKFFQPDWNAIRNFHGMWFSDSNELNDMFNFATQSSEDYWKEIADNHKYYKIATLLPPKFISLVAIKRLLSNNNAPRYWVKHNDIAKSIAVFGDNENIENLPTDWKDFAVFEKNQIDGVDYQQSLQTPTELPHGYNESKQISELATEDMQSLANYRGGKFLSDNYQIGDIYSQKEWECAEGHAFTLTPFAVVRGGHWCPKCNQLNLWNYDKLAKKNPFYASVWYDSHAKNENNVYYFDQDGKANLAKAE